MADEPIVPALGRHLRGLLRERGGLVPIALLIVTACVCAFLPLADHLGFELAMALTIVAALCCPAAGVAAIRRELQQPPGARAYGVAAVSAGLVGVLGVLLAGGVILLNGIRRPTCEPLHGAIWLALLPIPTALLAASVGAVARARSGSTAGAIVRIVIVELVSLLWSLSTLYWGPAFFLFDHFFGYFPGPLYDEVVSVSPAVLVFRGMTVLWAITLMVLVSAWGRANPTSRLTRYAVAAGLALTLIAVSAQWGTDIGFRSTDQAIAAELGGKTSIDDLDVYYPREWPEKSVEEFRHDAAFRAHQVITDLGITPHHRVRIWVYRSAEEKLRLVGAADTSFTKPWRHEIQINASAFPHPVMRHELVHAFAAEIAGGPFNVPGGLFPNSPLIEGFAVALGRENDGMTLMKWAKAMRDLKLAPDLSALLSATGFFESAPARAYAYAGAFIQYLLDRFGRQKVLELYASGDLRRLGDPRQLVAGFEHHLDTVSISPSERAMAERRFIRPSIFHRQCAREVSRVTDDAQNLLAQGRTEQALAEFKHACVMEPDDPWLLDSLLSAEIRAKNVPAIEATSAKLLAHPKADSSLRSNVLIDLCDEAWRTHRLDEALKRCSEAAQLPVGAQAHRNAVARVGALRDPDREALLEPLFVKGDAGVAELFRMNDFLAVHPQDALIAYLLGRQFVQRDAIERGLPLLERARAGLQDVEMRRENLRLIARASAEDHRCDAAAAVEPLLAAVAHSASDQQFVDDWVQRCRFEVSRGWKPL